ncbi:MAG TPA: DUF3127 domain-containing protein [Bacteroidetes bacterium]|nr:DUF3127 domain-containing protein [Bacteroidota bacterium]
MVIEGKLHAKMDAVQITDTFRKREFVVEYVDNPLYPQYVKFETTQDRCALVDSIEVGDKVEVTFNLRGREWVNPQGEKKYFTTLDAWRVQKMAAEQSVPAAEGGAQPVMDMADLSSDEADDLPF